MLLIQEKKKKKVDKKKYTDNWTLVFLFERCACASEWGRGAVRARRGQSRFGGAGLPSTACAPAAAVSLRPTTRAVADAPSPPMAPAKFTSNASCKRRREGSWARRRRRHSFRVLTPRDALGYSFQRLNEALWSHCRRRAPISHTHIRVVAWKLIHLHVHSIDTNYTEDSKKLQF